jgi:hypothetical protein
MNVAPHAAIDSLVQEGYLRLVGQKRAARAESLHFFGVAAQMMRRILVDHARAHRAAKVPARIQSDPDERRRKLSHAICWY